MPDFLSFAESLAREAGALLREGYGKVSNVEYKGVVDLVTEYDRLSEELILSRLRAAFPTHRLYAEESGKSGQAGDYEWLVDPLDGTVNFAHGVPIFAVSLALTYRRQLVMGVVYDPMRDELFAAEAGQGATLNGRRLRVSAERELSRSLLATGFPYDVRTSPQNNFAEFVAFYRRSQAVRRAGSAALDCCYVACGRFDGYWEYKMKPYDIGAAALMVREAGGRVTTAEGDENFLGAPSIVASNGHIHEQMLRVLREGENAPLP
ncbi:MAG: inositol monophosphatase family protein [Anaerolineales bacterium]|nr:inositol monophosphatase family protein [Anaerolineales bacterium]